MFGTNCIKYAAFLVIGILLVSVITFTHTNNSYKNPQDLVNPPSVSDSRDFLSEIGVPQQKWNFTINTEVRGSPTIADLGGDDGLEILFSADNNRIYCVNSTGSLKWTYTCNSRPGTPAIADVDNDGALEILFGTSGIGRLYCIDSDGVLEWYYPTDGGVAEPCVANLDDDPVLEIMFGSVNEGKFYCIDGNGDFEWDCTVGTDVSAPACVANIDGVGYPEILYSEIIDYFHCRNADGSSKWAKSIGGSGSSHSSCFVIDINGDGGLEILVPTVEQQLRCLNSNGASRWTYSDSSFGGFCSTPSVADLNFAYGLETIVCSLDIVYCINSTGGLIWTYNGDGIIRSSQCIVDIDGDGNLEILVGKGQFGIDAGLLCVSSTGIMEWVYETDHEVLSNPCAADVDEDGVIEVFFLTSDTYYDIGCLHCVSVSEAPFQDSSYCWPSVCFMGDIGRTGDFLDSDADMLTNNYEISAGSSPDNNDTDTDERSDYQEFLESTDPTLDLVVPGTISDLTVTQSTTNSITLNWTAPGDNGDSGTATNYILKYSTQGPITSENWEDSINYNQVWVPLIGGTPEDHEVTGLSPGTTYWFAIVVSDETPNISGVSNSPEGETKVNATPTIPILIAAGIGIAIVIVVIWKIKKQ